MENRLIDSKTTNKQSSVKNTVKFAYIKDGDVYLKSYLNFPERKIGIVRNDEESSITYFVNRFELIENKVNHIIDSIERAQNKGSFLMKLIHLKDQIGTFNAIGDFSMLLEKLEKAEEKINQLVVQNRVKNLALKTSIIQELETLMAVTKIEHWRDFAEKFKDIKDKWIKTGPADKDFQEELSNKFRILNEAYIAKKDDFYEKRNKLIAERVKKYEEIIATAKAALANGPTTEAVQQIKKLRFEWKKVGMVPKQIATELKDSFKEAVSSIAHLLVSKPYINSFERKWEEVCEEAEKLASYDDNDVIIKLKDIQDKWRKLGKLTTKNSKKLVMRFVVAVDKVYELYYLNKEAVRKFNDFFERTELEQILIKIRILKDFITQVEEKEIKSNGSEEDLKTQALVKRKVYARKEILKDLTNKVSSLDL